MKEKLRKISDYEYVLEKDNEMNVSGKVIMNENLFSGLEIDSISQLRNVCCMPGVVDPVIALPDAHVGYGLPMGAVASFDLKEGVISSGLCGFDINCGINMLVINKSSNEIKANLKNLVPAIYKNVPCGVGSKGRLKLNSSQLDEVLVRGVNWAVENGYGTKEDIKHTEENGCMDDADASAVSEMAKNRGKQQLGTLGAGNHFLEIQHVEEIFDEKFAHKWGLESKDQTTLMLHCGSRGLGHQVASDYLKIHEKCLDKYKIKLPDLQLACAPFESKEGQDYFSAMKCAVNYSFTNRLVMTQWIRDSFKEVFKEDVEIKTVYGICHNIAKVEEINGRKLIIHRKGATRSYPDLPVLIAGSMGTSSYLLKGTEKALDLTFGSSAHGAGRVMSRNKAIESFRGNIIRKELEAKGEVVKSASTEVLAEEAPQAYKDVDEVIKTVHEYGISLKVAKLIPMGVIKG